MSGCRHRGGRACVEAHTHDGRARWDAQCGIGPRPLTTHSVVVVVVVLVIVVDIVVGVVVIVVVGCFHMN